MDADVKPATPDLDELFKRLGGHRPELAAPATRPRLEAAVAIVFHEPAPGDPRILFMRRAVWEGDPWSGHVSFPGGRRGPEDVDLAATATRETLEEIGIALAAPVARLDDFEGTRRADVGDLRVAPFVFGTRELPRLDTNHEVDATAWIPLRWMLDPASIGTYSAVREGNRMDFPCVDFETFKVWGLTYRILLGLMRQLELTFPPSR